MSKNGDKVEPSSVGKAQEPDNKGLLPAKDEPDAFDKKEASKRKIGAVDKCDICLEKVCRFTIMDVIEDHCRVRFVNVWAFLLIYVFFVLTMLKLAPNIDPVLKNVEFISMPPTTVTQGRGPNTLRTAKALLRKDSGAPDEGTSVTPKIEYVEPATEIVPCGTFERKAMEYTLEYLRWTEICHSYVNGTGASDQNGLGRVQDFDIHGPAGRYSLKLGAAGSSGGVKDSKESFKSYLRTAAQTLEVRDPRDLDKPLLAPFYVIRGQDLAIQPVVLVRDENDEPVPGIEVTVFSNPDAAWPPMAEQSPVPHYDRQGQKAAELGCSRSLPSDENGYARFECLKVLSSTWIKVNFIFTVNAMIFFPWNDPSFSYFHLYPLPLKVLKVSSRIFSPVGAVAIVEGPPKEIEEGETLPEMEISVNDLNGDPIAGIECYAVIASENGEPLPLLFRRQILGLRKKELLHPKSTASDSNGIARFTNLSISSYGNTMSYANEILDNTDSSIGMTFACDGVVSPMVNINTVKSKVAEIRFKRWLKKTAYITTLDAPLESDGSDLFMAVVRIVDKNGNGVAGKTVSVDTAGAAGLIVVADSVESTKKSGFTVITFKAVFGGPDLVQKLTMQVKAAFKVDGVKKEVSDPITINARGPLNPQVCSTLLFSSMYSYTPVNQQKNLNSNYSNYNEFIANWKEWDLFSQKPTISSGTAILAFVVLLPQAPNSMDLDFRPAGHASGGRRLSAEERRLSERKLHEHKHNSMRRLGEIIENGTLHEIPRRLSTTSRDSVGSITLSIAQAYSTKGKAMAAIDKDELMVQHEPTSITIGQILEGNGWNVPFPGPEALSDNPGGFVIGTLQGANGIHWINLKASVYLEESQKTMTCQSPPIAIEIQNPVYYVEVDTVPSFNWAEAEKDYPVFTTTEAMDGMKIKLTFQLAADIGIPGITPGMPALTLSDNLYLPGAVYFRWIMVPAQLQGKDEALYTAMHSALFEVSTLEDYKVEQDERGRSKGVMVVQIKLKQAGVFGPFGIMFGSAGTFSEPCQFEITSPPTLALEVLVGPKAPDSGVQLTQNILESPSYVRVTSNGVPIDGVMVFAKLVPMEGQIFSKLLAFDMVDMFDFLYSSPSGFCDDFENTWDSPACDDEKDPRITDYSGVSKFSTIVLMDGYGPGKIKFMLAENNVHPTLYPADPIIFAPSMVQTIYQQPPSSMPLGMKMRDLAIDETSKFVVYITFPFGYTDLYTYLKGAITRLAIGTYQGIPKNQVQAHMITRELFSDMTCLWIYSSEYHTRCSPLVEVPGPIKTLSYEVLGMTWKLVTEQPTNLALVADSLALTSLADNAQIQMPPGMPSMDLEDQNEICMEASVQSLTPVPTSRTIAPELTAATGSLVIPPPTVVEVGSMFLTRMKALTASGGPVRNNLIAVKLVATVAMDPMTAPGSFLQQIGNLGNTLSAVAMPDFKLDEDGSKQRTNKEGVASFPLSILKAKSGQYTLKFQVEEASQVLYTSPVFQVVNPITDIRAASDDNWNEVQVKDFAKNVTIPRQLKFRVDVSGNRSLEDLIDTGYQIHISIALKGISPKVLAKIKQLETMANNEAKSAAEKVVKTSKSALKASETAIVGVVENALSKVKDPFSKMSPELKDQCLRMPMAAMASLVNETNTREPELSDAVSSDPNIIDPTEMMTQFIRTMTGGGAKMATSASMRIELEMDIEMEDIRFVSSEHDAKTNKFIGTYEVKHSIPFQFVENGEYNWEVTVNGVKSKKGAFERFKAIKIQPTVPEDVWSWTCTWIAGIVGVFSLVSNTTKHHFLWIIIAIPFAIALICVSPGMEGSKQALRDNWPIVAILNSAFLLVTLLWGLMIELLPKVNKNMYAKVKSPLPFGQRRDMYFEMYTRRRLLHMIGKKCGKTPHEPHEEHASKRPLSIFIKEMFKPFNPETAFFFPSQLWVGFILALFSYVVMLIKSIQWRGLIEQNLNNILDKTIISTMKAIMQIENSYRLISGGRDLPDDALEFMRKQLDLVRGWFEGLVNVIVIGFTLGIILAAIITCVCLFLTFFFYRFHVMKLRNGICAWGKRADGAVVYDSMFMGQFIASTMVGFALIVLVAVIICLPFGFPIIWDIIWAARNWIIFSFLIPFLLNKISVIVAKKIIFTPFSIKHRAAASIFMFWQLWLSILGGITGALVRFVMGLVGVIIGLPTLIFPVTPEPMNKIMLLDSPHKTFLASVMTFHLHNHPIVCFAKTCLVELLQARKLAKKSGEVNDEVAVETARKRSKRWVILLLIKHPWLTKERKAFKLAERRREWEEKKAVKEKKIVVQGGKVKPSQEEQQVMKNILQMRQKVDFTQTSIEALETKLSKIRAMPEGPERKKVTEEALKSAQLHDI